MNYDKILRDEENNREKIYLYPLKGLSGWIACEASAEHLHSLLPNISYLTKVFFTDSVECEIKVMVVDKLSLDSILQKVDFVDEQTRLVITWEK